MLSLKNVNQYYGQSHTLWDVSFDVPGNACTCILGRNGVGKTTLMQSIMGLAPKVDGEVMLNGKNLLKLPAEQRAPMGVAYIPQGRQIFPLLSVEENIRTGFFASAKKHKLVPEDIYALFPVLKDMRNRRGGDLSGGQQQQLAIARALVLEPSVLLMDEPSEGIQPTIVQEIGTVITKLSEERNIAIVLVEQKLPFARRVGDHFVILDRGRLQAKGNMSELNDDLVSQFLSV